MEVCRIIIDKKSDIITEFVHFVKIAFALVNKLFIFNNNKFKF